MAVQDVKVRVPAGETLPVQKPGDFIYLKFADRKIAIIEDQSRFEMEAGDKYVSPNGFRDFQVQNLDQDNPVYVIFAVGKGDYYRQIIQGEIVIDPRIKTGEGVYVSDTRADHQVIVSLDYKREPSVTKGDIENLGTIEFTGGNRFGNLCRDTVTGDLILIGKTGASIEVFKVDPGTLAKTVEASRTTGGGESWRGTTAHDGAIYAFDAASRSFFRIADYGAGSYGPVWDKLPGSAIAKSLAIGPDGAVFAGDGTTLYKWTGAGWDDVQALAMTEQVTHTGKNWALYQTSQGQRYRIYSDEFQTVEAEYYVDGINADSGPAYVDGARYLHGGNVYLDPNYGAEIIYAESKTYDVGDLHYGRAEEQCSRVPVLLNPALLSEIRTDAAVTVEWDNGRAWVTGEVLRLILDLLGIDTSGRYLDGITAFKASADGREYNINLGGRTFAADEIADDFQRVLFPQVVEITALESLWSNRV